MVDNSVHRVYVVQEQQPATPQSSITPTDIMQMLVLLHTWQAGVTIAHACVLMLSLDDAHARVMLKKCTLHVGIKAEFRQFIAHPGLGHGLGRVASIGHRHLFMLLVKFCL